MKTTNFDEKIEDIKNGMSYTEYLTKWSCNASNYYYLKRNYFDKVETKRFQSPIQKQKYEDVEKGMTLKEFQQKYNVKGTGSYLFIKDKLKK